jgi:hypothetical protein
LWHVSGPPGVLTGVVPGTEVKSHRRTKVFGEICSLGERHKEWRSAGEEGRKLGGTWGADPCGITLGSWWAGPVSFHIGLPKGKWHQQPWPSRKGLDCSNLPACDCKVTHRHTDTQTHRHTDTHTHTHTHTLTHRPQQQASPHVTPSSHTCDSKVPHT